MTLALKHISYGYVLENGSIALEASSDKLADREMISKRYLGEAAEPAGV